MFLGKRWGAREERPGMFFLESGSATLILGGTYLSGESVSPHEKRNSKHRHGSGLESKNFPKKALRLSFSIGT
jgi:hypothetical protein